MKIAVYGASGYQGKLVLAELDRRGIDMVLVGRNAARLREAAATVGLTDAQQRVADTGDHDAMVTAFGGSHAVINCAGPFTSSGQAVVHAAITARRHYIDTAGEQLYIKKIFDTFAAEAERAGITLIPGANDAGVPADLIAHLLAERIQPIEEISSIHIITSGGPSRGSLRSMIESIDVIKAGGLIYDDGDWHLDTPARHTSITLPGDSEAIAVARFPLPEAVTIPRHVPARHIEGLAEAALTARLSAPPSPEIIDTLPEGPTPDNHRTQRFTYIIDAIGTDGHLARGVAQGPDTYGTTAVIAVESASRLAARPTKPGVLAPAQAYDPTDFLNILTHHGTGWSIEAEPPGNQRAMR